MTKKSGCFQEEERERQETKLLVNTFQKQLEGLEYSARLLSLTFSTSFSGLGN